MKKATKVLIAGMFGALAANPFVFAAGAAVGEVSAAATGQTYSNIAISQVSNYVNVRAGASTSSEIIGKIYNNCAATILGTVDGEGGAWYQIQSGTVTGYIKAEYFITGSEAEKIARKVGTMRATVVNASNLRLHEGPSLESTTLTMLSKDSEYVALEETGDFVKLQVDSDLSGYVHKDYVKIRVVFKQAVSLEEEARQKAETDRLKREADEAIANLEKIKQDEKAGMSATVPSTEAAVEGGAGTQQAPPPADAGTIAVSPLDTTAAREAGNSSTQNPPPAGNGPEESLAPGIEYGPGSGMGPDASGESGLSPVTSATRTAIVAYAKQFLGNPYVYGGTSLTQGADCSGFTMRIFEHFGIDTGRTSRDQADRGREIPLESIQPGDLLFYASGDYINHVAMYIGGGQVIHSSTPTTGIVVSPAFYRTPCKAVSFLD